MSPASSASDDREPASGWPNARRATLARGRDDHGHARRRGAPTSRPSCSELEANALGGLDLIVEQLDRVLEALHHQDVELAQMVIADDDRVDGRYLEVHQGILSLLALQAPVAGRPAAGGGAAAHDQAHRAHGRPVREHRQADPALRLRAARAPRNARRARQDGRVRPLGGRPVEGRVRRPRHRTGRRPRAPGPRDQPPQPRDLPPGDRDRRRPRHGASGRCT